MDLNALLAQIKAPSESPAPTENQPTTGYRPPFVSSPIASPPLASPQPQFGNSAASGLLSPGNGPASERVASDRTANLLNLLKFNQNPTTQANSGPSLQAGKEKDVGRILSMSKIDSPLASLDGLAAGRSASLAVPSSAARGESPRPGSSGTPQDLLLKLLNPKQPAAPQVLNSAGDVDVDLPVQVPPPTAATPEIGGTINKGAFTYVNPFDQLAASSPRRQAIKPAAASGRGTPDLPKLQDGRTPVEALLGIGSSKNGDTSVAQALNEVATQVDRDAQEAIDRVSKESDNAETMQDETTVLHLGEVQTAIHDAAVELQHDLQNPSIKAELESALPEPLGEAFEEAINDIAAETAADDWESAGNDAAPAMEDIQSGVRVFSLPMKPFVAIDLVALPAAHEVRQDIVMKIASMKKEFDQVDRTLANATSNFIVYALARGGGLRLIRQDDGANKQVFRKAENQIYHVDIAAPLASPLSTGSESVLATGANGSVFWTSVGLGGDISFEADDLDAKGFIFPPLPTPEENNTSSGQLKTRAKLSSRHPEFFAVGRGKSIHIIWPALATKAPYINSKTRVVDSEKYLSERCLKIATGKAGKDFAFSEDDTVIVSLDKAGRLKFWDIREHTNPATSENPAAYRHVETKTPLMTIPTSAASDKSRATSVMFVDKERPTTKGLALRYLIVGSKQNHTLQLWDLTLGKAVQELNFPQTSDVDAICSVCYHPKTSIVAVGHPTRNSVFFMYLSSPRYNLGSISQAELIQRLAAGDAKLPKPESTAIMTGVREISLASLGDLRSLAVAEPANLSSKEADQDQTLFEVYISHSRGIASLDIKRQDLGWDKDGKALDQLNASEQKMIEVKELHAIPAVVDGAEASETSSRPTETESRLQVESKEVAKDLDASTATSKKAKAAPIHSDSTAASSSKQDPLLTTKSVAATAEAPSQATKSTTHETLGKKVTKQQESYASVAQRESAAKLPVADPSVRAVPTGGMNIDASQLGAAISKALGNTLSDVFGSVLGEQLETLYKRIDEDKRVQEAAGAAKQDAVLRLVASTLSDNVEKNLTRIVSTNVEQSVIPKLADFAATAIKQQLTEVVPRELKTSLHAPLSKALQDPQVLKSITESVSGKVASHVESVFSASLTKTIAPAFQKLAVETAHKSVGEVEKRVTDQLQKVNVQHKSDSAKIDQLTMQRQTDSAKIDQLTTFTTEILDQLLAVTKTLTESQAEIAQLRTQLAESTAPVSVAPQSSSAPVTDVKDQELDTIIQFMSSGKLYEGTMKWLQSLRRDELFNKYFGSLDPVYLKNMDQLIILSVAAAVADPLEDNVTASLHWLEVALAALDPKHPLVAEHADRVMNVILQRLTDFYMALAPDEPNSPILAQIHVLVRAVKNFKQAIL